MKGSAKRNFFPHNGLLSGVAPLVTFSLFWSKRSLSPCWLRALQPRVTGTFGRLLTKVVQPIVDFVASKRSSKTPSARPETLMGCGAAGSAHKFWTSVPVFWLVLFDISHSAPSEAGSGRGPQRPKSQDLGFWPAVCPGLQPSFRAPYGRCQKGPSIKCPKFMLGWWIDLAEMDTRNGKRMSSLCLDDQERSFPERIFEIQRSTLGWRQGGD